MDVGKVEATSENSASKGNGVAKTPGTQHGTQEEQLKKRHQSGPSSCSSSPFEGDEIKIPPSRGRVSIVYEKEEHEDADHRNGWRASPKGDSKRIAHASTDCKIQTDRVLERPPVPRLKVDKMEEEEGYGGGHLGITRSTDKVEEKDDLVPEEREILDELVQAINSDDFKRVMFIQNVVKEKNKEQWDVLFRNLPKNCQCVLHDYETSLTKEDIRAIRSEVENELDDVEDRFGHRAERRRRYVGPASLEHRVASRPRTAPALGGSERRGIISPSRLPELSEAERYFLSRRSVSPDRRSVSPDRRSVSPDRRLLTFEDGRSTQDREFVRRSVETGDVAAVTRDRDFWRQKSHSLELQLRHISSELSGLQEEVTRARQQASGWPARVAELESANAELQRELEQRRRQERKLFDRASELEGRLSGALLQEKRDRSRVDEAFVRRVLGDYDAQGRELDQQRRQAAAKEDALAKAQSENQGLQRRLVVMQRSLDRLHAEKEAAIVRTFSRVPLDERPYSSYSTNYLDFAEETKPAQDSDLDVVMTGDRKELPQCVDGNQRSAKNKFPSPASMDSWPGFGPHSEQKRTASAPARSDRNPEDELVQLEKRYDHLQMEKRRLETELSHLPGPNGSRNRRHVIVEENRIEERLDRVTKELGSLRLTLKQRRVL